MVNHKSVSEGHERFFKYNQGPFIDIDIDFHQMWGKTGALQGDSTQLAGSVDLVLSKIYSKLIICIRTIVLLQSIQELHACMQHRTMWKTK